MTISTGDILKVVVTLVWTDGNIAQNVFNAIIGSGGGPFDDGDVVDDAEGWAQNMYLNLVANLSDEIDGSQVQVYKWDTIDDDWDEVGTTGFSYNPSGSSDQLPRGVAGLVSCRTADPDVQGKKYIPGIVEANSTDGLFASGLLTNMLAFAADWITDFVGDTSGANWEPGVWSPTGENFHQMATSISASAIPAYQRRRKRGVGA